MTICIFDPNSSLLFVFTGFINVTTVFVPGGGIYFIASLLMDLTISTILTIDMCEEKAVCKP